jgi:hypothetical protein
VIIAAKMEILFYLLYRAIFLKKSAPFSSQIFFGFAGLITGYILSFVSTMVERFYVNQISWWKGYFYIQSWFASAVGGIIFAFMIERLYQKTFRTHYFFTMSGLSILFVNLFLLNSVYFTISVVTLLTIIHGFLGFFFVFVLRKTIGRNRLKILFTFLGCLMLFAGRIFDTEFVMDYISLEIFLILEYPIIFLGLMMIFLSLFALPVFNDVDFRENLEELYIISKITNEIVYYYNFRTFSNKMTEANQLMPGGILGLQALIRTMTQTSEEANVELIEQDEICLLMDHSPQLIFILGVRNHFRIHDTIIRHIRTQFDEKYGFMFAACEFACIENTVFNGFEQIIQKILYN